MFPSNATLEDFAAQLTQAAYCVALRHGVKDSWLDVEIELWRVLADGPCRFHLLAMHQFLQNLFQSDSALPSLRFAVLEFNPSFVEAIEHLHTRPWMFHPL